VEIDGAVHREPSQQERDRAREAVLGEYSLSVLRFTNEEVIGETETVVEAISRFVLARSHGSPSPPVPLSRRCGRGGR
jgi:very-short-patch-repair endonuclease